jgi:hypothetical protein
MCVNHYVSKYVNESVNECVNKCFYQCVSQSVERRTVASKTQKSSISENRFNHVILTVHSTHNGISVS